MRATAREFFVFLAVILTGSIGFAQQTGTVKGTLTDDSGGIIPAITVSLTGNGTTKTVQTQSDGSYVFPGVRPGSYTVNVTVPGFEPAAKPAVVTAGGTLQLPIQLAVAAEKQEVTVAAQSGTTVSVEPDNNAAALVLRGEDL
jgi:hypothetical protein